MSHPRRAQATRRRGSIMILVIGTLLLLMISCMAYLEVTRQDRRATIADTRANCDVVARGIITHIQQVLLDDVVYKDPTTGLLHFFDENITALGKGGIEPYDYPYTNNATAAVEPRNNWYSSWTNSNALTPGGNPPATLSTVKLSNGNGVLVRGGHLDDPWLASTYPSFTDSNDLTKENRDKPFWPHITNLMGIWVELPKRTAGPGLAVPAAANTNSSGTRINLEYAIDSARNVTTDVPTNALRSDTKLIIAENKVDITGTATGATGFLATRNPLDANNELEPLGFDADGDGIPDSRWAFAPTRQINGITYVMAVRIIDNSSLVNVNVATAVSDASGAFPGGPPRFWYPSEIDLTGFCRGILTDSNSFASSLAPSLGNLLNYRQAGATVPMTWSLTATSSNVPITDRAYRFTGSNRTYGPVNSAALNTAGVHNYTLDDELELRYHNGLNSPVTVTMLEDATRGMGVMMRSTNASVAGAERHYMNLAVSNTCAYSTTNTMTNSLTSTHDTTKMREFFTQNPRTLMTVYSGAAIYASPSYPDETGTNNRMPLKLPINDLLVNNNTNAMTYVREAIGNVYTKGDAFTQPAPLIYTSATNYFDQMVASIKDYADADNYLSQVPGSDYFGMEALPFVAEIYVQVDYKVETITPDPAVDPVGPYVVKYKKQGYGYVIELRNPFRRKITLKNVWLRVGGAKTELDSLMPNIPLDSSEGSNPKYLMVYRNCSSGSPKTDVLAANSVTTDPPYLGKPWNTPAAMNDGAEGKFVVALHAAGSNGTELSWPYQSVTFEGVENHDTYSETVPVNPPPVGTYRFKQKAYFCNANGINIMAQRSGDFHKRFGYAGGEKPVDWSDDIDALDAKDKTTKGAQTDYVISPTNQQMIITDGGRFGTVGELAQIAFIGPTSGTNLAQVWRQAGITDISKVMLKFTGTEFAKNAPASGSPPYPDFEVPHAVLLFNRFTTIMPTEYPGETAPGLNDGAKNGDKIDNNGDGAIDGAAGVPEQFVPGTININTVSGDIASVDVNDSHLLQKVLPIPNQALRALTVKGMLMYREKVAPYNNRARTAGMPVSFTTTSYRGNRPGIAHLGELFEIVNLTDTATPITMINRLDYLGRNGIDDFQIDSVTVDQTPGDGAAPADVAAADDVIDDREEAVTIPKWLTGVLSTRSDVFTAYIVVRGYPSDDFRKGPVEQRRYIVVFDRSGIVKGNVDEVKVLGIREY